MTDIAVIILNFNGLADTRRALRSLRFPAPWNATPIVIDNGSDADEAAVLRAEFPEAHVERVAQNLGFARGVNYGARIALAEGASYLLLLNSDAWFEDPERALRKLVAAFAENPGLAAAGPVIVDAGERIRVQSAGYRYSTWWPVPRPVRSVRDAEAGFTFLSGSCLMIDAPAFAELGGLDPDFFLYGEDLDFSLRARRAGYELELVPDVRVRHKRGASSKLLSDRYVYTALRGNLITIAKHARWYHVPSAALTSVAASLALTILAWRSGNARAAFAVVRAWNDFFGKRWGGLEGYVLEPAVRPSPADYFARTA